jgi:hypothetical protein
MDTLRHNVPYRAALLGFILNTCLFNANATDMEFINAPETGVELGIGWDSATSTVVSSRCVRFAPIQEGGQILNLDLQEVSDSSELAESLNISASASVSGLVGSGSARASIAKNKNVKASSTTFAVRATAQNGIMFAGPVKPLPDRRFAFSTLANRLIPFWMEGEMESDQKNLAVALEDWALDILKDDGKEAFRRYCGDYFVAAITSGAEALAVITFETRDESVKEKLSASISASYSIASASAEVDLDHSSEASSSKLKVSYIQVGGARGEIPSTNDDVKHKLKVLAAEAAEAPMFYEIGIKAYADLPDWPEESGKHDPVDSLNDLLATRDLEMFTLYSTLESVLANPSDYSIDENAELFVPRYQVLSAIQDKALMVRQLIAQFQIERQKHELNLLDGRPLGDIKEILNAGNALVKIALPEIYKTSINPDTKEYQELLINVVKYLKALNVPKIRLWLPLPGHVATPDNSKYAEKVVEYYVGRQTRRMCKRAPVSEDCLNNQQLSEMQYQVLPNYFQLKFRSGAEGYLFTTNKDIKGCLRVTENYQATTISQVGKNDLDLKDVGCTLFKFDALDEKTTAYQIKAGDLNLTRDGVRVYLASSTTNQIFNQWSINFNNKLGTGAESGPRQCITAEKNRQVGAATCADNLVGWFFVPKTVLPD